MCKVAMQRRTQRDYIGAVKVGYRRCVDCGGGDITCM